MFSHINTDPLGEIWTLKIHSESYKPLTNLGILKYVSFNANPVLLDELESLGLKETADAFNRHKESMIGSPYIHPLAPDLTRVEKHIVIKAGKDRYKRDHNGNVPDVFWPPETAMDHETAEVLVENGYKAFFCARWQLHIPGWENVENTPVKINLRNGQHIFALPYSKKASGELGFGDISNAYRYIDNNLSFTALQLLATDGETFGHHRKFGDLFLDFFIKEALPNRGFKPITTKELNYDNAPTGYLYDRSAWSCPCGNLARWNTGCGCTGPDNSWKEPFYQTFKNLSANIARVAKSELGNNYHQIVADKFEQGIKFKGPTARTKPEDSLTAAVVSALVARTSCGTFYGDPHTSGRANMLFGLVSIYNLYDSGLVHTAREIENQYMQDLSKMIDPKNRSRNGKDILDSMVNQRIQMDFAPSLLGLSRR